MCSATAFCVSFQEEKNGCLRFPGILFYCSILHRKFVHITLLNGSEHWRGVPILFCASGNLLLPPKELDKSEKETALKMNWHLKSSTMSAQLAVYKVDKSLFLHKTFFTFLTELSSLCGKTNPPQEAHRKCATKSIYIGGNINHPVVVNLPFITHMTNAVVWMHLIGRQWN